LRSNLFKSGQVFFVVDIHSHILPEVDDGPKSWDVSVAMCRAAAADGITHMVATPHANDRYHYDRDYLQGLLNHLQQLAGDAPQLSLGCDFHLSYDNLQDALAHPTRYVIGKTRYLLVEFSNFSVPQQTAEYFFKLGSIGLVPIITREPATGFGVGRTGLRDSDYGIGSHWFLGGSYAEGCVVAAGTSSCSRTSHRCARHREAGSDSFHRAQCRRADLRSRDRRGYG
jgi:hypothetical protein